MVELFVPIRCPGLKARRNTTRSGVYGLFASCCTVLFNALAFSFQTWRYCSVIPRLFKGPLFGVFGVLSCMDMFFY
ncbi:hypothetical protein BT63DRAFT_215609 [Microthyrium microscopicum]|uniref:Uncharacterized protein n=1 Tax=Microthyrium microscopicum TaxID=703497 RepID=A0A6A6UI55_9PEZI|nr:hypothetical protein BT63DRAFT_215609 [Microthyrium microscopicum]